MKNMILSDRLLMSAALVTPGSRVADIGCDHAHTDIWLLENNIAVSCIACDVRTGPLQKAKENLESYGCLGAVELRLANGLEKIAASEVDSVIIAGMGGLLTVDILTAAEDRLHTYSELILQPQSHVYEVRDFLNKNGFVIADEKMCCELDKYYVSIKAIRQNANSQESRERMSEEELMYGPVLLKERSDLFLEYIETEYRKAKYRLEQIAKSSAPEAAQRFEYFNRIVNMTGGILWKTSK